MSIYIRRYVSLMLHKIFSRKIGKYVLILWHILVSDLVPFIVVSIVTLYFLLREEEREVTVGINKEKFVTSLDVFPGETG